MCCEAVDCSPHLYLGCNEARKPYYALPCGVTTHEFTPSVSTVIQRRPELTTRTALEKRWFITHLHPKTAVRLEHAYLAKF